MDKRLCPDLNTLGSGGIAKSLDAERILINGNHFTVCQDFRCRFGDRPYVVSGDQGSGHHAPEGEMGAVFVNRHAVANFKHVGIIPVIRACILPDAFAHLHDLHDSP